MTFYSRKSRIGSFRLCQRLCLYLSATKMWPSVCRHWKETVGFLSSVCICLCKFELWWSMLRLNSLIRSYQGQRYPLHCHWKMWSRMDILGWLVKVVCRNLGSISKKHCHYGSLALQVCTWHVAYRTKKKSLLGSWNSSGISMHLHLFLAFFFSWCLPWKTLSQ